LSAGHTRGSATRRDANRAGFAALLGQRTRQKRDSRAMGNAARVCMRKARVLCGETDTQTGRVVLRVSEGEIGVRRGWQTTRTRRKMTRAARAKIGPSRSYVLCAGSHAVAVAAAEQTCVYGQGGCEARSDARSGNKRANVFSFETPKKDTPPKNSRAQSGPFAVQSRVAFYSGQQLFQWSFCPWSCCRIPPLIGREGERYGMAKMESKVAASLAGCSAFELNRL